MSDDDITTFHCLFPFFHSRNKGNRLGPPRTITQFFFFSSFSVCLTIASFRVTLATGNKGKCMLWVASGGRRGRPLLPPEFLERTLDALLLSARLAHTLALSKMK